MARRWRAPGNLTSKQVKKLIRDGIRGAYYDGMGLRLEIKGQNAAGWVSRYQIDGQVRYMGLGSARVFDLQQARERNRRLVREQLADAIDPVLNRRAERAAKRAAAAKMMTFSAAAKRYITDHRAKWSNAKHAGQWEQSLRDYVEPIIGSLPVADIDVPMVLKVLEQNVAAAPNNPAGTLWSSRAETAAGIRGRIESVLDWSKARGLRSGDNPAAWSVIGKILPARTARAHHAALDYRGIPQFMIELRQRPSGVARALELCILCAVRTGEVLKAKISEIDFDAGVWTVPPEHTKLRREHRVPLAPAAINLLRDLPTEAGNDFVFIGKPGQGLGAAQLLEELKRIRPAATTHGMRSAFRVLGRRDDCLPARHCRGSTGPCPR